MSTLGKAMAAAVAQVDEAVPDAALALLNVDVEYTLRSLWQRIAGRAASALDLRIVALEEWDLLCDAPIAKLPIAPTNATVELVVRAWARREIEWHLVRNLNARARVLAS